MSKIIKNEIFLDQKIKRDLLNINYYIESNYNTNSSEKIVPKMNLFGPYNTNNPEKCHKILKNIFNEYDFIQFKIKNFGLRADGTIVINIESNEDLTILRNEIYEKISPYASDIPSYQKNMPSDFNIILTGSVGSNGSEIRKDIMKRYSVSGESVVKRVETYEDDEFSWSWNPLNNKKVSEKELPSKIMLNRARKKIDEKDIRDVFNLEISK